MGIIYQIFGNQGKELVYKLLTKLAPELTTDMKVGIKPNLVVAKESKQGATTAPQIVAGIIEYLQSEGLDDIIIMEGAWVGADTNQAFQVCGYQDLAEQYNIDLYNLKNDQTQIYESGELEVEVCHAPLEVDYLINVPVLKAHCQTKMTCALKNLKGCLPDAEKRRFHTLGLHEPIAQLNNILKADLTIVDGIIGDLTFEEGGNPIAMNRLLAGYDPVLIDSYVADLMGLDTEEVDYIKLAGDLGVGSSNLEDLKVKSLNRPQATNNLREQKGSTKIKKLTAQVEENQACSACLGSLVRALYQIEKKFGLPHKKVYIGQGWQKQQKSGLGVGSCTSDFSCSIKGCPPSAKQIKNSLIELWNLK